MKKQINVSSKAEIVTFKQKKIKYEKLCQNNKDLM